MPVSCSTVAGQPAQMRENWHEAHGWPTGYFIATLPPNAAHSSSNGCSKMLPMTLRDVEHVLTPPCTLMWSEVLPAPHLYTESVVEPSMRGAAYARKPFRSGSIRRSSAITSC